MKNITAILLTILFLSSCATTMQNFKSSDLTEDGVRYGYGADAGVRVGDTIVAYKKTTVERTRGLGFVRENIGSLTIISVNKEFSLMKKNGEFELNDQVSFQKQ